LCTSQTPAGDPGDIQNLLNIVGAAEEHGKSVEKVKAIHDRIKEIWRLKLTPLSSQEDPDEDE
jgi:hypothetical protein